MPKPGGRAIRYPRPTADRTGDAKWHGHRRRSPPPSAPGARCEGWRGRSPAPARGGARSAPASRSCARSHPRRRCTHPQTVRAQHACHRPHREPRRVVSPSCRGSRSTPRCRLPARCASDSQRRSYSHPPYRLINITVYGVTSPELLRSVGIHSHREPEAQPVAVDIRLHSTVAYNPLPHRQQYVCSARGWRLLWRPCKPCVERRHS